MSASSIAGADSLATRLRAQPHDATASSDVRSLEERIAALERHDRSDAEVVTQMAAQIQALTTNSAYLAARLRLVTYLAAGAAALALALAVIMWLTH